MKRGDVDLPEPPTLPFPAHSGPEPEAVRSGAIIAEDVTTISGTYSYGDVIGKGGMGEVVLARDRRIGRDVALKRLRSAAPTEEEIARFLREARIQARLDHPAIVPVYELARDTTDRPYFTMKRLSGQTLSTTLAARAIPRQRLLRAFVDVCRAVDFAHSRGIVHRDLKPSNIVLGEFGEVYVLDWGVARVLGDVAEVVTADIDTLAGAAFANLAIGTPAYMAPEQAAAPNNVGRAADIYSLGAILFEILTGEHLHTRTHAPSPSHDGGEVDDDNMDTSPSHEHAHQHRPKLVTSPAFRRPDRAVPPELDALCSAMLSTRADQRPTARRCAERVENFLDGDRDHDRRRKLAIEQVNHARVALADGRRGDAMRLASHALALDAECTAAGELVTTLMLTPPRKPPPELRAAIHQADAEDISRHARAAIPGYVLIAAFLPIIVWNGVLSWPAVIASAVIALAMAFAAHRLVRKPQRSLAWMVAYAIGNALVIMSLARLAGPLTFVPALVSFMTASVITYPTFLKRPYILAGIMLAGFLLPIGLESLDWLPASWQLVPDGLLLRGNAMALDGPSAMLTIVLACTATVVMAGIQSTVLARAKRTAQHQLVAQAWHLRQLLPVSTIPRTPVPSS
jgi:eukaryotic-like serine/threonine-protein kinase